jgi:uncharacterized protein YbaA (DUF1428 family)
MAKYVDGFVIALPKNKIKSYQKMSKMASKVWKKYGALDYYESVGEDLKTKGMVSFLKMAKTKPNETVVFAWITYKSRKHRDQVNAKVMKDPKIANMDHSNMPFDPKRMAYGGFNIIVKA